MAVPGRLGTFFTPTPNHSSADYGTRQVSGCSAGFAVGPNLS